jgi:hypothetical protein
MNDDDLRDCMRAEFAQVKLAARMEDVVARGRRLRRGRTLPALGAGTGTVAAVLALTFSLAGAGGPANPSTHAVLTAWSVKSGPPGTVTLTIRDQPVSKPDQVKMREALRAAGVRAVVQTRAPRACQTIAAPELVTVSRHDGVITVKFKLGRLAQQPTIAVILPVIEIVRGRQQIVRLRPGMEQVPGAVGKELHRPVQQTIIKLGLAAPLVGLLTPDCRAGRGGA